MKWFKKSNPLRTDGNSTSSSPKVLFVSDTLSAQSVFLFSQAVSKEEIVFKLIGSLSVSDHAMALNAVLEREKMGGTVLESNVAVPHARLKGLTGIRAAIGICQEPPDSVRIYVLFLSPSEDTRAHLLFLASVASLFQVEGLVDVLSKLTDVKDVIRTIQEVERSS